MALSFTLWVVIIFFVLFWLLVIGVLIFFVVRNWKSSLTVPPNSIIIHLLGDTRRRTKGYSEGRLISIDNSKFVDRCWIKMIASDLGWVDGEQEDSQVIEFAMPKYRIQQYSPGGWSDRRPVWLFHPKRATDLPTGFPETEVGFVLGKSTEQNFAQGNAFRLLRFGDEATQGMMEELMRGEMSKSWRKLHKKRAENLSENVEFPDVDGRQGVNQRIGVTKRRKDVDDV